MSSPSEIHYFLPLRTNGILSIGLLKLFLTLPYNYSFMYPFCSLDCNLFKGKKRILPHLPWSPQFLAQCWSRVGSECLLKKHINKSKNKSWVNLGTYTTPQRFMSRLWRPLNFPSYYWSVFIHSHVYPSNITLHLFCVRLCFSFYESSTV